MSVLGHSRRCRVAGAVRAVAWAAVLVAVACSAPAPAPVPEPDLAGMEAPVKAAILAAQRGVAEAPRSAAAWGRLGMVLHVHELWDEAIVAYRQASTLDPGEVRWHYFLGDVLQSMGTAPESAEERLRRAVELAPDYAPAHMRLGQVLVAAGRPGAAAAFERALELDPTLQPARVGLAQLELAAGRPARTVELAEEVLAAQPRNGRALAALAQALARLGRREAAREVAERAAGAADYNLFSDPLMAEVVALGVSSNLLWERAKAYLEAGQWRQAVAGLERVVELLPDNPGVRHQLAFAYRGSGQAKAAIHHLERAVELEPERLDARAQLAVLLLENGRPVAALEHLRWLHREEPEDADTAWLIGSALLAADDPAAARAAFAAAAETVGVGTAPSWALDDWGNALARLGRFAEAVARFRAALEAEPERAQSHFHLGLALEALGRPREAIGHYRRAMEIAPNDLVADRLASLAVGVP